VSDWKASLECEEGGSHKFWRARCEGTTLYVNFGRIGTNGQTQVKQFASAAECEKELASLERSKRKKGYQEAGATGRSDEGAEDEDEGAEGGAEPPAEKAAKPTPVADPQPGLTAHLSLASADRKVDMRLTQEGSSVRIVAVEQYDSAQAAAQAFARLEAALKEEGYQPAKVP
jgi:predicted DNA-binding WGR domain protein